jgi:large subunit ribosomal protein L30
LEENKMEKEKYAVIRVRGSINASKAVRDTLLMLKLPRINNCVIIPKNDSYKGMLQKAKDYITWGEVDGELVAEIMEKKGAKEEETIRLHPPIKGYEGIKRSYKIGGALGYRGKDINELLKKMI